MALVAQTYNDSTSSKYRTKQPQVVYMKSSDNKGKEKEKQVQRENTGTVALNEIKTFDKNRVYAVRYGGFTRVDASGSLIVDLLGNMVPGNGPVNNYPAQMARVIAIDLEYLAILKIEREPVVTDQESFGLNVSLYQIKFASESTLPVDTFIPAEQLNKYTTPTFVKTVAKQPLFDCKYTRYSEMSRKGQNVVYEKKSVSVDKYYNSIDFNSASSAGWTRKGALYLQAVSSMSTQQGTTNAIRPYILWGVTITLSPYRK